MYHNIKKQIYLQVYIVFSLHDPISNFHFFFSIEILVVGKNIWSSEEDSFSEENGNENNSTNNENSESTLEPPSSVKLPLPVNLGENTTGVHPHFEGFYRFSWSLCKVEFWSSTLHDCFSVLSFFKRSIFIKLIIINQFYKI